MEKKGPFEPLGDEYVYAGPKEGPVKEAFRKKLGDEKNRRLCNEEPHAWTTNYSNNLKDLVMKLLNKDQTQRLGSKNDADEILEHPVFKKEFIQKAKDGDYDAPAKPLKYDFD